MKLRKMIRKAMEAVPLRRVGKPAWSPTVEAEHRAAVEKDRPKIRATGGKAGKGRMKRPMMICPAKIYRRHPDADTRDMAVEQAQGQHRLWGPCVRGHWKTANPVNPYARHWIYPAFTVNMRKQKEVI